MSTIRPDRLLVSSDFFSVQGEGISSGIPSYFIRLGICNLTCGMSRKFANLLAKEQHLEDGEIFVGDLQAEGTATWTCDSTSQWLWRGEDKDFQYLIDRWKEQGLYEDVKSGLIHLIWTGGEPTIKGHQVAIINFLTYWYSQETQDNDTRQLLTPYHEIETNGTVYIDEPLFKCLSQINCSPKLSNSGMSEKQRINPEAIRRIMEHSNYQFKFVISNEEDVQEMFRDYVKPFNIPLRNVVVMPGLDDQADFHERTRFSLEMAKKYRVRGLTRLHISGYNQTLNV
jgi:7-carboxy-7-deazaguanine synthase